MKTSKLVFLAIAGLLLLHTTACKKDEDPEAALHPRGTKVIVISDMHLNDRRSLALDYAWLKDGMNDIVAFLDSLATEYSVGTLVVNGDMFDEWVAPLTTPPFVDGNGNATQSEADYFNVLVRDNQPVVDAFKRLKNAGCELVYVPGNHDMEITAEDFDRVLPCLFTQARDADGLGTYTPKDMDEVVIEHGHRYDFFCAPDPFYKKDRILPIGLTSSKYGATIDQASRRRGDSYASKGLNLDGFLDADDPYHQYLWDSIVAARHLEETLNGMGLDEFCSYYADIVGMVGDFLGGGLSGNTPQFDFCCYQVVWGVVMLAHHHPDAKKNIETLLSTVQFSAPYSNHLFYNLLPLYYGFPEEYNESCQTAQWQQRCQHNHVAVEVPLYRAMLQEVIFDNNAKEQYFDNPMSQKRIVVMGHSHNDRLLLERDNNGQCCIYANTGTWVDPFYAGKGNRTHTYVEIIKNEKTYCVKLKQYPNINPIKTLVIKH